MKKGFFLFINVDISLIGEKRQELLKPREVRLVIGDAF